jgi:hypothetical protein
MMDTDNSNPLDATCERIATCAIPCVANRAFEQIAIITKVGPKGYMAENILV